jgi:hypothetical protein
MRLSTFLLLGTLATLLFVSTTVAQTFDLQFVEVLNDGVNFDVKVQIKASSTFALGTSNLVFDYNTDLTGPVLQTAHRFSGGSYQAMNIASGPPVSINIELNSAPGDSVTTTFQDVATIRFTTANPAGSAVLTWNSGALVVFKDDEATIVSAGTLTNLNSSPLPIQLASFTAAIVQAGQVKLTWSTLSETNNYGFEVQKAADSAKTFESIPNSFIAGNGTTTQPHEYTYTDVTAGDGTAFYRLKQTDLDGTVHFSESVQPSAVTGVAGRALPTEFALEQNYPNPFNPSTVIEFAVPKEARVRLDVYNLLGQKIATLVDENLTAGYYTRQFNGTGVASGLYFYRLSTNDVSFLKKMMLVK